MGNEAICVLKTGGKKVKGKALLETSELGRGGCSFRDWVVCREVGAKDSESQIANGEAWRQSWCKSHGYRQNGTGVRSGVRGSFPGFRTRSNCARYRVDIFSDRYAKGLGASDEHRKGDEGFDGALDRLSERAQRTDRKRCAGHRSKSGIKRCKS